MMRSGYCGGRGLTAMWVLTLTEISDVLGICLGWVTAPCAPMTKVINSPHPLQLWYFSNPCPVLLFRTETPFGVHITQIKLSNMEQEMTKNLTWLSKFCPSVMFYHFFCFLECCFAHWCISLMCVGSVFDCLDIHIFGSETIAYLILFT